MKQTFKENSALSIGELASQAGCNVQTIRYYEQVGLLPRAERSGGNQRLYGPGHRERLTFIRRSRELGFTLDEIRDLLSLADTPERSCEMVDRIAAKHLSEVQNKLGQLRSLERELKRLLDHHGGPIADCRIVEALSHPNRR